jgi:hypothetical protein
LEAFDAFYMPFWAAYGLSYTLFCYYMPKISQDGNTLICLFCSICQITFFLKLTGRNVRHAVNLETRAWETPAKVGL